MTPICYSLKKMAWLIMTILCLSSGRLHAQVYSNSQTNGVTGLCVLCSVNNPNNAVGSTSLNDYSTFSITAGLLGTTVYQTLIFPAVSTTGCDSLIIGIGSSDALLSVNLFSGITVQTFNGVTANNDVQQITSSSLRLLQSNTRAEVLLKPVNTFDRVKITLSSSLVGLLNGFRLYYAYHKPIIPTPTAIDSTAICAGGTTTLTATGITGSTIRWYNAANGGTLLFTGSNYVVSTANTATYYAEANVNGCTSSRKPVKVIVNPKPANPVYLVPQGIVCGSAALLVSNYTSGINYSVSIHYVPLLAPTFDTAYTVINSNLVVTPAVVIANGGQAYVNIQAVNSVTGCRSDTVSSIIVIGSSARLPVVNVDSITICKGDTAAFTASNPVSTQVQFFWYDAPFGGNLLFIGPTFKISPQITTTYYVAARYTCEFPTRKAIKVIVTKLPDPIFSVPQGVICGGPNIKITNHQPGFNYRIRETHRFNTTVLYDTSFLIVNKDTFKLPGFSGLVSTTANISIQAIDPITGCKSDTVTRAYVQGNAGGLPSVTADSVTICNGNSTTLHAFVPDLTIANIYWYNAPVGGTLLFTGNDFTVSPTSNTTYYVTSGVYCEYSQRKRVNVYVNNCMAPATSLLKGKNISSARTVKLLQLFPNPTTGEIRFVKDEDLSGSLIIVKDLTGREVQREILRKNGLSLSKQIPAGLYFIQVTTIKKEVYSGKILLQQ
jgi:hypothetical protein